MVTDPSPTQPFVRRQGMSLRTERRIKRAFGAVGIAILGFTLGGAMEGDEDAEITLSADASRWISSTSDQPQFERLDIVLHPGDK